MNYFILYSYNYSNKNQANYALSNAIAFPEFYLSIIKYENHISNLELF